MFLVYDKDEGRIRNLHEINASLMVIDSTTYYQKGPKMVVFTTISKRKAQISSLWTHFWDKKLSSNKKLIQAT